MRSEAPPLAPALRAALNAAAEAAGVATFDALLAAPRSKTYAMWRQALMLVLRDRTTLSYPEIAGLFRMDHTTVMHGVRRARRGRASNEGPWPHAIARLEALLSMDRPCLSSAALCQGTVQNV